MRKLICELLFVVALILFAVLYMGESVSNVLVEMFWFYTIMGAIGVALTVYIGWALTKSMNPPKKNTDEKFEN